MFAHNKVLGRRGIFRLCLTSDVFQTAFNSSGYCMGHESTKNRELIYKGTPTLSQKYNVNFDPFALFLSGQRIVGRNSQEIETTLF